MSVPWHLCFITPAAGHGSTVVGPPLTIKFLIFSSKLVEAEGGKLLWTYQQLEAAAETESDKYQGGIAYWRENQKEPTDSKITVHQNGTPSMSLLRRQTRGGGLPEVTVTGARFCPVSPQPMSFVDALLFAYSLLCNEPSRRCFDLQKP